MKKIVGLRLGTFLIPGIFWIVKNGKNHYDVESKPAGHRHLRLLKDFGFNTTYKMVTEISFGQITSNGSYDGLLGLIQRNEVDTVIIPLETFIKNPPGDFGPVLTGFSNVIMTYHPSPNITIEDLLFAANLFDVTTYFLLVVIPLIWFIIMGIVSSYYSLWNIMAMALCHNYCNYTECSKRLLQTGLVSMFLFLEYSFSSCFSTDMAVVQPPKLINKLEDLYLSSLKPMFLKVDNLYVQFMESDSPKYKNVWKKVHQCGYEKCLFEVNPNAVLKLDFSPSNRDFALVHSKLYLPIFVNYVCNFVGKEYRKAKDEGQNVYISKPFSTFNYALIINRNSLSELRQRLIEFSYFNIESGYIEKAWKDSEQFLEPVYGCFCPHTFFDEDKPDILPDPVSLSGLHRVVIAFFVAVAFGIIFLVIEIAFARLQICGVTEPVSTSSRDSTAEAEKLR